MNWDLQTDPKEIDRLKAILSEMDRQTIWGQTMTDAMITAATREVKVRYRYKVLTVSSLVEGDLNLLGQAGWELISTSSDKLYLMKADDEEVGSTTIVTNNCCCQRVDQMVEERPELKD